MHFVGHTRFSLYQPRSRAWALSQGDNYKERLFADRRLIPRLRIFTDHSLRLLEIAQRGHSVRLIVSYSREMPGEYRTALHRAADNYPFVILDECVEGVGQANMVRTALQMMERRPGVFATFRVDDDDILPVDYFDRMSQHIRRDTVGSYVSLGRGVTATHDGEHFGKPHTVVHRMYSAGLLSVCSFDGQSTETPSPAQAHNRADEAAPTILDSRDLGFVWTRSLTQDTATVRGTDSLGELDREISRLPESNYEDVERLFPGVFSTSRAHGE